MVVLDSVVRLGGDDESFGIGDSGGCLNMLGKSYHVFTLW